MPARKSKRDRHKVISSGSRGDDVESSPSRAEIGSEFGLPGTVRATHHRVTAEAVRSAHGRAAAEKLDTMSSFPAVFVFDLDDTLWDGDIDMTSGPPFRIKARKIEAKKGDSVSLFRDVPEIFAWLQARNLRAAVASHTSTPRWAEAALQMLKIDPAAVSFAMVAGIKEMHGASKNVHLRRIASRAGCDLADMVFYDNARFNIVDGEEAGVVSCHTPYGLSWESFVEGLTDFSQRYAPAAADDGSDPDDA